MKTDVLYKKIDGKLHRIEIDDFDRQAEREAGGNISLANYSRIRLQKDYNKTEFDKLMKG